VRDKSSMEFFFKGARVVCTLTDSIMSFSMEDQTRHTITNNLEEIYRTSIPHLPITNIKEFLVGMLNKKRAIIYRDSDGTWNVVFHGGEEWKSLVDKLVPEWVATDLPTEDVAMREAMCRIKLEGL